MFVFIIDYKTFPLIIESIFIYHLIISHFPMLKELSFSQFK
ncbi:hypothetical protein HMPREF0497_1048 [Lentilactobacillus buchneri ATCC 11577]|uniref:Uncharacterized protein n=1 Tax=Lentilactobacillus hilgardii (strain ATCC 8290 / DSM 20176 / CCUG 30140 / JCM 1155 / KCTC 3500 / NBRC 15886 / NCIMB 8040 / NRRL B-1843 / 9) TaxID=1423757 RepID=C0XN06_LENH9|nr:hypothetical protein HMPREF0497_1048 [Lentilactobacillus buchneri ATCC 11577]EEI23234.1 hypothetical protein HMPREF0519_2617 [Lentilactobacillus hilgardii DSM 20176 = ATCC 8290]